MIKTEKVLHLNSSKGRKVRVVREHYVREQVPCGSSFCQANCHNGKKRSMRQPNNKNNMKCVTLVHFILHLFRSERISILTRGNLKIRGFYLLHWTIALGNVNLHWFRKSYLVTYSTSHYWWLNVVRHAPWNVRYLPFHTNLVRT